MHDSPLKHPLPDGWSTPTFVQDVILVEGLELHRSGVASSGPDGVEVTGSAASVLASCAARSYFELLERVTTLASMTETASRQLFTRGGERAGETLASRAFPESDEPSRWRFARSNGVALHADWQSACDRALWELVERDRVLRAWYGETCPQRLVLEEACLTSSIRGSYEVSAYRFPAAPGAPLCGDEIEVVGVFGFPRTASAPYISGYGARSDRKAALDAAVSEALQMLAFLWGEELPARAPQPAPTPMAHLEHLLWPEHHQLLKRWLEGEHLRFGAGPSRVDGVISAIEETSAPLFVDLTPSWLGGGLRVAKALSSAAMPLAFGDAPFAAHLPPELRIHPIA